MDENRLLEQLKFKYVVRGLWKRNPDLLCYATEAGFASLTDALRGATPQSRVKLFDSPTEATDFIKKIEASPAGFNVSFLTAEVAAPILLKTHNLWPILDKCEDVPSRSR